MRIGDEVADLRSAARGPLPGALRRPGLALRQEAGLRQDSSPLSKGEGQRLALTHADALRRSGISMIQNVVLPCAPSVAHLLSSSHTRVRQQVLFGGANICFA